MNPMNYIYLSAALFSIGAFGVLFRRNAIVVFMCVELMLNAVNLALVTFAQQGASAIGAVLVFLIFVVAASEIAIAIPIVLLLARQRHTLDVGAWSGLKG